MRGIIFDNKKDKEHMPFRKIYSSTVTVQPSMLGFVENTVQTENNVVLYTISL